MRKLFKKSWVYDYVVPLLFIGGLVFAQEVEQSINKQYLTPQSIMKNPGFENGRSAWASSGTVSTFTIETSTSLIASGLAAGKFNAVTSGDILASTATTVPNYLLGQSCVARAYILGGDNLLTLEVWDGSTALAAQVLSTYATYQEILMPFTCPVSGTVSLRLRATGNAAVVYIDDTYMGINYGSGAGSGSPDWYVNVTIDGVGANFNLATTSVSYQEMTDSGMTLSVGTASLDAFVACSGTNQSTGHTCSSGSESNGISFVTPSAGPVMACATFAPQLAMAAASDAYQQFNLVETPDNAQTVLQTGAAIEINRTQETQAAPADLCSIFYFNTSGKKTLRMFYAQTLLSGTINSSTVLAATGDNAVNWRITPLSKASSSGVAEVIGTLRYDVSGGCSWTDTSATWAQLPSNPSCTAITTTGQALDVGNNAPQTSFTNLPAGNYTITAQGAFASGASTDCQFDIYDGTTFSPAMVVSSGATGSFGSTIVGFFQYNTLQPTVQFDIRSIRLAGAGNCILDVSGSERAFEIVVTRYPTSIAPGNERVTTQSTTEDTVCRLILGGPTVGTDCTSDPCTIRAMSGTCATSVTWNSTGNYNVNFSGSVFSSPPVCNCSGYSLAGGNVFCSMTSATTSTLNLATKDDAGAFQDSEINVICIGPK